MKKSFVSVIFILWAACLSGQHYFGLKGAAGLNSVDVVPKFNTKNLNTANTGILYRYEHKRFTALQVELSYVNKGYIQAEDTARNIIENTQRISSIELPLMAQGFVRLGGFRPYITGGAVAGYILSRSSQVKGEDQKKYIFDKYDRRFEYGIAGGAGMALRIKSFEIQGEWRYIYNFSFLRDPIIPGRGSQSLSATRMEISLSLLYRFKK
ncbi:MAG: PorT family protein [Prevotellaceae bacterium]|jgi:hypothetical protein|nr:PorT family protein [Prevotellaceae bacterium]